MPEIVCLGIVVADVIARPVDSYPRRGELSLCSEMRPSIGGCAANTGIGLQKLGVPSATIGKVGRDGFGDIVRGILHGHGVDTRGIATDEKSATSATMVMIASDGERSFIHYTGANAEFTAEDVNWEIVRGAKLLHVAGHFVMPKFDGEPCAETLKKARAMGLKTALDTVFDASGAWMEKLRPVLPYIDYFVPSFHEARQCFPALQTPRDVARAFQDEGVGVVALKMGEAGSYLRSGGDEWHLPAYTVPAVDATGAGDAFAAGFLAGVVRGYDMEKCGRLGNAAGACCVTQVGTVAGIRSLDETLAFIESHGK
jgi:sugar/nucleoside kinase (ribokinase family)